jgi:hypothetical protein
VSAASVDIYCDFQYSFIKSINNRDLRLTYWAIRLFQLATQFDFVAHTLAATSAQRLAVTTKSHEASLDAFHYRKQALHGLYRAMGSFSKDNADAILAASLGCTYIMSDS